MANRAGCHDLAEEAGARKGCAAGTLPVHQQHAHVHQLAIRALRRVRQTQPVKAAAARTGGALGGGGRAAGEARRRGGAQVPRVVAGAAAAGAGLQGARIRPAPHACPPQSSLGRLARGLTACVPSLPPVAHTKPHQHDSLPGLRQRMHRRGHRINILKQSHLLCAPEPAGSSLSGSAAGAPASPGSAAAAAAAAQAGAQRSAASRRCGSSAAYSRSSACTCARSRQRRAPVTAWWSGAQGLDGLPAGCVRARRAPLASGAHPPSQQSRRHTSISSAAGLSNCFWYH